jgi:cytochrome c peroxidase
MHLSRPYRVCLLTLLVTFAVGIQAHGDKHDGDAPAQILAPGYAELSFKAPPVGSYGLPVLGAAGGGDVLATDATPIQLSDLLDDKPTLLSFIYTTCDDVNGCPLATYVLSQVNNRIQLDPRLKGKVRLLSLSFDPHNDTPTVMHKYGRNFHDEQTDWHFLTTADDAALEPILRLYNQSVAREYDENGQATTRYSHILRVYLIDAESQMRNIYSVSFLHADTIINDIKTLMTENSEFHSMKTAATTSALHGAGDDKNGYEELAYETQSDYLPNRIGEAQDLLAFVDGPPLGLPALLVPASNPLTAAKVALGRKMFFDRRLSLNQTISCAMCHVPEQGFTHNEIATAVGFEGRTVRRNSPTIYNVGYHQKLFHDARDDRLEHQVWQPLLARNEMANPSVSAVINKLRGLADYAGLFERAFAGAPVSMRSIGMAIASYERTLVSANSPFDRWHYASEESALGDSAKRGFDVFTGQGRCTACHLVGDKTALFTDHKLHNTGIGFRHSMKTKAVEPQRVLVAPGTYIDVDPAAVSDSAEAPPADLGYYEITQDSRDRWKYRTPSLRNIDLSAPYMHDGSLLSLNSVVEFYDRGGIDNPLRDSLIQPLNLTSDQKADLIAFLHTLTGDSVDRILRDAFDAPVGNAHYLATPD